MRRTTGKWLLPLILAGSWGMGSRTLAAGFTLEQILSSPFPSSLAAAPQGSRLAWVFNEQGLRNIWVAEGPTFQARRLTSFAEDDGRDLSIVGFTPTGSKIVFRREGRFNPAHDPAGAQGTRLFWMDWEGQDPPREIARAWLGAVSPREEAVAYVEENSVWLAPLEEGAEARKLFTLTGSLDQLTWSPEGGRLAVVSQRGKFPHQYSFIVVFDLESNRLHYVDPAVYLDSSPRWSPDGTRLAFLRRLTSGRRFSLAARKYPEPDPWEIRVAEGTGKGSRAVWRSPDEDTFFSAALEWGDSQTLVFLSEKDGWRHLYAVPAGGGEERELFHGEFEVESFSARPEAGLIHLTCNAGDIDRRHLWKVSLGGQAEPLTRGPSIEWSPVLTGDGEHLAFLGSDARHPAHPFLLDLSRGERVKLAPEALPRDFPLDQLVEPEQVVFQAADGWNIHGQLFLPPGSAAEGRPAVLHFHGGPIRQMLLGWHYSSYYHNAYAMNQYLASRGYVVLSVNFRLGIGYGRAFRDVPNGGPRGAAEYQDLLAAAAYLRGRKEVDPRRMALWGGSYGGLMTALGLARNSDLFAAGVDFHGVHDWNQWQAWATGQDLEEDLAAWKSSPVADLDSWRSPVLLIHGDDDRNVPFSETLWLAQELDRRGVPYELLVLPDEVHGFLRHQSWLRSFQAAADFLDRHLKKKD